MLNGESSRELEGRDQDGEHALHIHDQIIGVDVGGCGETSVESGVPEHEVEGVHLKGERHDEEVVGKLVPLIHPVAHVEQREGEREVERRLDVGQSRQRAARAREDAVQHNNEDLEDENI